MVLRGDETSAFQCASASVVYASKQSADQSASPAGRASDSKSSRVTRHRGFGELRLQALLQTLELVHLTASRTASRKSRLIFQ